MPVKMSDEKFDEAVEFVVPRIRNVLSSLSPLTKESTYEIRMRANKPVVLVTAQGSVLITDTGRITSIRCDNLLTAGGDEIDETFSRMCGYSVHSHAEDIANGFVTLEGGHRAGICGTAVYLNGSIKTLRDINTINLRIARENRGAADRLFKALFEKRLNSIVIAGPPSSGKTTVLRDLARRLSGEDKMYKISIVDERCEIASVKGGIPQTDTGINCDVLSSYSKGDGIMSAVRSLSPDMIVCDEVGGIEEISAIEAGLNSGIMFAVSVHACSRDELIRRPQLRRLLMTFAFDYVVLLNRSRPCEISKIYRTDELTDEIRRNYIDLTGSDNAKSLYQ
ncbi:MAG: Flp pilus assembly complex ATPase component TadA [Clostridiales bacterium]|nr:Flp pilus assembly complex ATPase component TadA [Clostridiales bacterium]